jgi:chromodomain-helicase-DNA-binding protein 1
VDFFGNSIKALELSQQLNAMKLLSKEISSLGDPYAMFRLDDDAILQPPKWAGANNWTVQDDSMLLLGCQLYGIGHWDSLAADDRLGLTAKLQGAVKDGSKVGDKQWPQGTLSPHALQPRGAVYDD